MTMAFWNQGPDNNTIQRKQADWAAPDCRCPDPEFVPFGYAPGIDEWHCLSGYVGKARKVCPCNGEVSASARCAKNMRTLHAVLFMFLHGPKRLFTFLRV